MAIILVAGNSANMPELFSSVKFLTTGIVAEFPYSSGLHREALFAIGLVLFVFIMIINLILNGILKNGGKKEKRQRPQERRDRLWQKQLQILLLKSAEE